SQPQIFGSEFHPVVVLRDFAFRGEHDDGSAVRKLSGRGIVLILKTRGFGQSGDRIFRPGEEVPALSCAGTVVAVDVLRLFGRCGFWSVVRIEADREHIEFFANVELQYAKSAGQP